MPGTLRRIPSPYSRNPRAPKRAKPAGPIFNETPTDTDPRWTDDPEHSATSNDQPRSGPPPDLLARSLSIPCHPASDNELRKDNAYYRCVASSVYSWKLKAWDRSLPRVYKHAVRCKALRNWKPVLWKRAEAVLASMAPGGLRTSDTSLQDRNNTPDEVLDTKLLAPSNPFTQYDSTFDMSVHEQMDHALARLVCVSAVPARLVDYPEWSHYTQLLNPSYNPPNSTYVRDQLIPAEARRAVLNMREYLQNETNISLSFDGLTAGQQPVYTVHICTADRYTFLFRADVFYGSHNSNYVVNLLEQVIEEIGPHRIASVVSDDTAMTKKARRDASKKYPWILNLADPLLKQLRKLLTHFKMSTYAAGRLNEARRIEGILRGLQSIGNTRFATIYYAATSVLENLPALYRIYRNKEIDTKGTPLPPIVADALKETAVTAMRFREGLTELVNILEPFARALLSLESTRSNLSDVYFFWLGALAALDDHFKSRNCLLKAYDRARIRNMASRRFNQAINDAPTDAYLTAFFLDPRFRNVAIYAASIVDSGSIDSTAEHPPSTGKPQRLNERLYERIRKQLFTMLKAELEVAEGTPDHPLHAHSEDALLARELLREQLAQYYHSEHRPLPRNLTPDQSPLQFWCSQKQFEQNFVLAYLAEKLFSVLPNSMCDERTGSRLTHLYSKLRTRLDANSMFEQIQFMQWAALVDGSHLKRQKEKLQSLFKFDDIPADWLPQNQVFLDSNEPTPALDDESGDQWLDTELVISESSQDPVGSQVVTRTEELVDLTSKELISLFSKYSSLAESDASLKSEDALMDESAQTGSEVPARVFRRAKDISWE